MFHNVDINALSLDFISVDHVQSFDQFFKKCKHDYDIYLFNDEWHCTCPNFMEHATCEHVISFNFFYRKIPSWVSHGKLLVKKWRRPKNIPRALEHVNAEDDDEEDHDIDDYVLKIEPVSM